MSFLLCPVDKSGNGQSGKIFVHYLTFLADYYWLLLAMFNRWLKMETFNLLLCLPQQPTFLA